MKMTPERKKQRLLLPVPFYHSHLQEETRVSVISCRKLWAAVMAPLPAPPPPPPVCQHQSDCHLRTSSCVWAGTVAQSLAPSGWLWRLAAGPVGSRALPPSSPPSGSCEAAGLFPSSQGSLCGEVLRVPLNVRGADLWSSKGPLTMVSHLHDSWVFSFPFA